MSELRRHNRSLVLIFAAHFELSHVNVVVAISILIERSDSYVRRGALLLILLLCLHHVMHHVVTFSKYIKVV